MKSGLAERQIVREQLSRELAVDDGGTRARRAVNRRSARARAPASDPSERGSRVRLALEHVGAACCPSSRRTGVVGDEIGARDPARVGGRLHSWPCAELFAHAFEPRERCSAFVGARRSWLDERAGAARSEPVSSMQVVGLEPDVASQSRIASER